MVALNEIGGVYDNQISPLDKGYVGYEFDSNYIKPILTTNTKLKVKEQMLAKMTLCGEVISAPIEEEGAVLFKLKTQRGDGEVVNPTQSFFEVAVFFPEFWREQINDLELGTHIYVYGEVHQKANKLLVAVLPQGCEIKVISRVGG